MAPPSVVREPLAIACLVAFVVVGIIAAIDLGQDGVLNPSVLALVLAMFGPLTPALIMRYGRNNHTGKSDDSS